MVIKVQFHNIALEGAILQLACNAQIVQWLESILPKDGARVRFPVCAFLFSLSRMINSFRRQGIFHVLTPMSYTFVHCVASFLIKTFMVISLPASVKARIQNSREIID